MLVSIAGVLGRWTHLGKVLESCMQHHNCLGGLRRVPVVFTKRVQLIDTLLQGLLQVLKKLRFVPLDFSVCGCHLG